MLTKRPKRQYSSEIINLESMIPENHFLRVIEKYFDWNFIYDEVEKQYSVFGRPSIDPVVLFKIHILKQSVDKVSILFSFLKKLCQTL